MANNQTLRNQSSAPSSITPSTTVVYANSSNVVLSIASGGAPVQVGNTYTGVLTNTQVQTGTALYQLTGTYFGVAQGALFTTGLACPKIWVPIQYNGVTYALPAYNLMP